jgi:SAM-dependent methyltransferase
MEKRIDATRIGTAESASYDDYVRAEWALFSANPARTLAARQAIAGMSVTRVLDVGCGGGQELRPYVANPACLGVGVDAAPEAGHAGRGLFAAAQPGARVTFARARAEHLPFRASSFDVVICRLALPYTDNARALGEIARVLRPGGVFMLKCHHARYYVLKLREALAAKRLKPAINACRVLAAGLLYHLTGTQPRRWISGGETFQTMWLLRRELGAVGLEIQDLLEDSVPAAPSLLIRRSAPRPAHTSSSVGDSGTGSSG